MREIGKRKEMRSGMKKMVRDGEKERMTGEMTATEWITRRIT